jgi:RNA polymerase sigma-70 factor (ECF subfamily)
MDGKNSEEKFLAACFEAERPRLRRVAYRMLGSLAEADDAVQESWLRLSRADTGAVENLGGWLTTVVARIALDMLRARKARREAPPDPHAPEPEGGDDPARERDLADSVGIAMLVVLEALEPAERIAFVLHDMFDLPFDQIAPIVNRSAEAARKLASRARQRVRAAPRDTGAAAERKVVDAFLSAARSGDLEGLLAVLDPQVVMRGDAASIRLGGPRQLSGSHAVAKAFQGRAQQARTVLIDGRPGILVAPHGRLLLALAVTFADGRIAGIETIADPERLARLTFALPD